MMQRSGRSKTPLKLNQDSDQNLLSAQRTYKITRATCQICLELTKKVKLEKAQNEVNLALKAEIVEVLSKQKQVLAS